MANHQFNPISAARNAKVTIGDGSTDDLLVASDDGEDNSQLVTLNVPHPLGDAYDLTLTSSDDSDIEVWDIGDPTTGSVPLLGDGNSSATIHAGANQLSDSLYITGLDDTADETADVTATLILTGALVSNTSGQPSPVGPTTPADSNPVDLLADALQVAKINDGTPVTGQFLSTADMQGAGAFVPLDNNDWDYINGPDLSQSGAVVGDKYLLPVTLKAFSGAKAGDYYFLSSGGKIRVFLSSDRTRPVFFGSSFGPTKFSATAQTTLYIEGTGDTTAGSPTMLYLNFVKGGAAPTQVASCKITVFTITGSLDEPGNGFDEYTSDLRSGSWLAPTGGITFNGATDAVPGADVKDWIEWKNTPEFGEANFQASPNFIWSCQVNVVKVSISWSSLSFGKPMQNPNDLKYIYSAKITAIPGVLGGVNIVGSGVSVGTLPVLEGPSATPGGLERGVQFIQFGLIQNAETLYDEAFFTDGDVRYEEGQGADWYVDYLAGNGPWYEDVAKSTTNTVETTPDPTGGPFKSNGLSFVDTPSTPATDTWGWLSYVQSFKIVDNFRDFFVAKTTYSGANIAELGGDTGYVPEAEAQWTFNGSGNIDLQRKWTPIQSTGDYGVPSGTTSFGPVVDHDVKTDGPSASSLGSWLKFYWG